MRCFIASILDQKKIDFLRAGTKHFRWYKTNYKQNFCREYSIDYRLKGYTKPKLLKLNERFYGAVCYRG